MYIRHFSLAILSLIAAACQDPAPEFADPLPVHSDDSKLVGVWQSDGYGYVIAIHPDSLRAFDATDTVCVESDVANTDISDFYDRVSMNAAGSVARFSNVADPYEYQYHRIPAIPNICVNPTPDSPLDNFDALVSYFDAHYAFFDLYDVDWSTSSTNARTHIDDATTDAELFATFNRLLEPIKDAHVEIDAIVDGEPVHFDANPGLIAGKIDALAKHEGISIDAASNMFHQNFWFADVRDELLHRDGALVGNNRIQYGILEDGVGYMAFLNVGRFVGPSEESAESELEALDQAMDDAFTLFAASDVGSVIIDLSVSYGGYDFVSRAIAGRFAHDRTLAYSKVAHSPGAQPYSFYIEPSASRRFPGRVYVLTSDITVSGSEILTLALRALPNVTHVGTNTRGALSDKLSKSLPNGWEISLSNEVYSDADGIVWEGRGIPPEIEIPVFDADNPMNGHIDAVRSVVELIRTE